MVYVDELVVVVSMTFESRRLDCCIPSDCGGTGCNCTWAQHSCKYDPFIVFNTQASNVLYMASSFSPGVHAQNSMVKASCRSGSIRESWKHRFIRSKSY